MKCNSCDSNSELWIFKPINIKDDRENRLEYFCDEHIPEIKKVIPSYWMPFPEGPKNELD